MSSNQVTIPKYFQTLIDKMITERSIKNTKVSVSLCVKPGDNWLGNILKIEIVGNNKHNQSESVSFIAKLAPTEQIQRDSFPISSVYKREIYMYNLVIPQLIKFQEEKNIKNIFAPFAKCYETNSNEGEEIIILKNMQSLGYQTVNHRRPVTYDHALLAMKYYGKFHALSFALKAQKPEVYEEIRANLIKSTETGKLLQKLLKKMACKILNYLEKEVEIYNAFKIFLNNPAFVFQELILKGSETQYGVILHLDSQLKNMLFKYKVSHANVPIELCLVDWQLSAMNNPCLDIAIFIWICTDKQLRDKHYFDLIDSYYSSFSSFLNELGEDSEKMYPRAVFENHLKKYSSIGLFGSIWSVSANLLNPDDVPNLNNAENTEILYEKLSSVTSEEYFIRIRDNIVDFINYGYILNADDFYAFNKIK